MVYANAGRSTIRLMHWLSEPPSGMQNDSLFHGFDNMLGSITLETDEHARLVSREEYYPFGGTALLAARSEIEVAYKTLRYSGKERDATGLYYYGYRYMAPWLCRWLNPDRAGLVDGLNVFGFVGNNPVNWSDRDGRIKVRNPFEDGYDPNADSDNESSEAQSLPVIEILPGDFSVPASPAPVVNSDMLDSRPASAFSLVSVELGMFDSRPANMLPVASDNAASGSGSMLNPGLARTKNLTCHFAVRLWPEKKTCRLI